MPPLSPALEGFLVNLSEIPLRAVSSHHDSLLFFRKLSEYPLTARSGLRNPFLVGPLAESATWPSGGVVTLLGTEAFAPQGEAGFMGSLSPFQGSILLGNEAGGLLENARGQGPGGSLKRGFKVSFRTEEGTLSRSEGPAISLWELNEKTREKALTSEGWYLSGKLHRESGPATSEKLPGGKKARYTWALGGVEIFRSGTQAGILLERTLPWDFLNEYILQVLGASYGLWKKKEPHRLGCLTFPEVLVLREHLLHYEDYREMPVAWWGPLALSKVSELLETLKDWHEGAEEGEVLELPGKES